MPVFAVLTVYATWLAIATGILHPQEDVVARIAFDVITRLLLPLIGLAILYRTAAVRPADYWLISPSSQRPIPEVLGLFFLSTLLLLTYIPVANLIGPGEFSPTKGVEHGQALGTTGLFLAIVYLAASASFSEEIFFRAIPRLVFAPMLLGKIAYLFASSSLFGLLHVPYGIHSVAIATYFGFVAALVFLWTNNLWYPIAGHFVTDTLVMCWRYEKYGVLPI